MTDDTREILAEASAVVSPCGTYRYSLVRRWEPGPLLPVVMLNPSTADAVADDPTIRRVVGFAKRDGWAGVVVVNLYALRATDPRELRRHADPVGPDNDDHIRAAVAGSRLAVVAWGANEGPNAERAAEVLAMLTAAGAYPCAWGLTKGGSPRHPLYLRGDAPLSPVAVEVTCG